MTADLKKQLMLHHFVVCKANHRGLRQDILRGMPQHIQDLAVMQRDNGEDVIKHRRAIMGELPEMAEQLRPETELLLRSCPPAVAEVLRAASPSGIHLAFIQVLLELISWADSYSLIDDLMFGFPFVGAIPVDVYSPAACVRQPRHSAEQLLASAAKVNDLQYQRMAQAQWEKDELEDIAKLTQEEIDAKRIVDLGASQPSDSVVAQRFGTSKGVMRRRMIDNFHEPGTNDTTSVERRIRMGRIADLLGVMVFLSTVALQFGVVIGKSDFKGSYRNCPISPAHHAFSQFLFMDISNQIRRAVQHAMPFGAVASVYAWDRLGAAVTMIVSCCLILAISRYVDDIFWADFKSIASEAVYRSSSMKPTALRVVRQKIVLARVKEICHGTN